MSGVQCLYDVVSIHSWVVCLLNGHVRGTVSLRSDYHVRYWQSNSISSRNVILRIQYELDMMSMYDLGRKVLFEVVSSNLGYTSNQI